MNSLSDNNLSGAGGLMSNNNNGGVVVSSSTSLDGNYALGGYDTSESYHQGSSACQY